ncbi:hypothetical protein TMA_071 [Thermus phage TMA]|uniref:hypothetical protein n=1 Tax=Thermus phage TMA TaxID=699370 RepID=UPI00021AAE54|nr:hypothetical protein TMA_071 [Thermus phage TMA]BAK53759.1 hypothetical protein TMA_071 [Thermus phage TMA]
MSHLNKVKTVKRYEEYLQKNFNFREFNLKCSINLGRKKISTNVFYVSTDDFLKFLDADEIIFAGENSMIKISLFRYSKKSFNISMETLKQLIHEKTIYLTNVYRIYNYNLFPKASYSFSHTIIFFKREDLLNFRKNELYISKIGNGIFEEKILGELQQISYIRNLEKIDVF